MSLLGLQAVSEPGAASDKRAQPQPTCPKSTCKAESWQAANCSSTPGDEEMAPPSTPLPLGKDTTNSELEVSMLILSHNSDYLIILGLER